MTKKRTNTKLNKGNGEIHVVNLNSYTRPEIIEQYNKDYVEYGEDNDYFQYLIDRYNGSPTNNAAIIVAYSFHDMFFKQFFHLLICFRFVFTFYSFNTFTIYHF